MNHVTLCPIVRHLWKELGLDELIDGYMRDTEAKIPVELISFLMVANRLIDPLSKLAGTLAFFLPPVPMEEKSLVSQNPRLYFQELLSLLSLPLLRLVFYTKHPGLPFCVLGKGGHISGSSRNSCGPGVPELFSNLFPPLQDEKGEIF